MDALAGLGAWLADGGAWHADLVVREGAWGRGLVARRVIAPGTVVVRVPRRLLITRELVEDSAIGRQIRAAAIELSSAHVVHAAWLLAEDATPRSPWRPYLDGLPRTLGRFPIFATAAERALLDGSLAGVALEELRTELVLDHVALQARVPWFRTLGRDALTWARLTAGARLFSLTIDGVETTALVPFAELLNHGREAHAGWRYDQDAEAVTITTVRAVAAGDEVCVSYGDKSNGRLLVQYGFCADGNPHDEAELRVPAPFRVTRDPAHAAARQMLDWIRDHHAAGDAGTVLAEAARLALAGYAAGDDDALLAGDALSENARTFIRARRGEKEVLRAWLDIAAAFAGG